MGKLAVSMFMSMDGVIQGPGGPREDAENGFDKGGWVVPYFDESMTADVAGSFGKADALLLGRVTYQLWAAHWPRITDPDDAIAKWINTSRKYVASRTLKTADWQNSTLLEGEVVDAVRKVKAEHGLIEVQGSADLLQTLMAHDLVDEYRLWHFPVLVGRGKKLFRDGAFPGAFQLVDSNTTETGVVRNTYVRDGELKVGSFLLD